MNKLNLLIVLWTAVAAIQFAVAPAPALNGPTVDRCSALLEECEKRSQETLISKRAGYWDALRKLKMACDLPEVDPRLAAKAAFLYLSLPEFSSLESELRVLEGLETRLQGSEGADDILAATLDWKASTLDGLGREVEALEAFERLLQFSQERFGRGSFEEAKALLHLGQLYAKRAEASGTSPDTQRATDYGDAAVRALWQSRGAKDPRTREMVMHFEALLESLGTSKPDIARWTERYRVPAGVD